MRLFFWWASAVLAICFLWLGQYGWGLFAGFLFLVGCHDRIQTKHAILKNYPVVGHLRFVLEFLRPELRQYFLESDNESVPFSRAERSLVYQRAKGDPDKRPFGTQLDVSAAGYEWLGHAMCPTVLPTHDFRITIGASCAHPYNASLFNISAMSFGALSANAILALNAGAQKGHFAHDTGEGSISVHHRVHGGDLIWEIGSGYFGCRNEDGTFSLEKFKQQALLPQVKMIELKLSQGAKPGHGGVLPGEKVTPEIAEARGVPMGIDCVSPAAHSAFDSPLGLVTFLTTLREASGGKPVGIKLCIGHVWEWFALVKAMVQLGQCPDFIVVDGAEGGTGAAPVEFTNHMGMPLQEALRLVHNTLVATGLRAKIKIGAAGKVTSAFDIARLLALGADWTNAGRGFMFAIGCIQAQTCHTGKCPTGVATQDAQRQQAIHVPTKADRVYAYHQNTLKALKELLQATGVDSPDELTLDHVMRRVDSHRVRSLEEEFPSWPEGSLLDLDRLGGLPEKVVQSWARANPLRFS
jgi:glutamate synthase domain-containing protein 2